MLSVASEAGVAGGGDGCPLICGCATGTTGGATIADGRSYDSNEPSKKALDLDLVIISF